MKVKRKKNLKVKLTPIQEGVTMYDNLYKCHYCTKILTWATVTVDHKKALSEGGNNHPNNLVPACFTCNNRKKSLGYGEFIRSIKIQKTKRFI